LGVDGRSEGGEGERAQGQADEGDGGGGEQDHLQGGMENLSCSVVLGVGGRSPVYGDGDDGAGDEEHEKEPGGEQDRHKLMSPRSSASMRRVASST